MFLSEFAEIFIKPNYIDTSGTAGSELNQTQMYCLHDVTSWTINKLAHANSTSELNHVYKALSPFYVISQFFSMNHILSPPETSAYITNPN